MGSRFRRIVGLAMAALLPALTGCFGVSQNPSYFPHLLPTGDIIRTHAKPPGHGYFADFDPHACRIDVLPLESTSPVRTQYLLVATVSDEHGQPRRSRRVEWMLEGVGNIVEVDESGYFAGRGYKVDNKYAVSYTDYCEHTLHRGSTSHVDDVVIHPGQTWCVITSAVEGDTTMTAYAPEIADWDRHKVFVTKHWVNAEWCFPPPAVCRAGAEAPIVTQVNGATDRQPLANYRVRYRLLDGAPAMLLPGRTQEAVVVSDLSGHAAVSLAQAAPTPGTSHLSVEIIRPPDPNAPGGAAVVVGRGVAAVEWQAAQLGLTVTAPQSVEPNQEIPLTVTVTNGGQAATQALLLRQPIPAGMDVVRSEPPAAVDGGQLVWQLASLPGGQQHKVTALLRAARTGTVTTSAYVQSADGLTAEGRATTQVATAQLQLQVSAPEQAVAGDAIAYEIALTNPGGGPATNANLRAGFDAGLEHETKANPLELPLGLIGPGATRSVKLILIGRQPGSKRLQLSATADGGLSARAEQAVTIRQPRLSLQITGPATRAPNRPASWEVRVGNPGELAVTDVKVSVQLPPEVAFRAASDEAKPGNGQVAWQFPTLAPGEQKVLKVDGYCARVTPRTALVATATAAKAAEQKAEAPLEILGMPALKVDVSRPDELTEVGGRLIYTVRVSNQGTLAARQVELTATASPQTRPLHGTGPTLGRTEGPRLTFAPLARLEVGQAVTYQIEVEALQPGDARLKVEAKAEALPPVTEEEAARIVPAAKAAR